MCLESHKSMFCKQGHPPFLPPNGTFGANCFYNSRFPKPFLFDYKTTFMFLIADDDRLRFLKA